MGAGLGYVDLTCDAHTLEEAAVAIDQVLYRTLTYVNRGVFGVKASSQLNCWPPKELTYTLAVAVGLQLRLCTSGCGTWVDGVLTDWVRLMPGGRNWNIESDTMHMAHRNLTIDLVTVSQ